MNWKNWFRQCFCKKKKFIVVHAGGLVQQTVSHMLEAVTGDRTDFRKENQHTLPNRSALWWFGYLFLHYLFLPLTMTLLLFLFNCKWETIVCMNVVIEFLLYSCSYYWFIHKSKSKHLETAPIVLGKWHYFAIVFLLVIHPSTAVTGIVYAIGGWYPMLLGMLITPWILIYLFLTCSEQHKQVEYRDICTKQLCFTHAKASLWNQYAISAFLVTPLLAWIGIGWVCSHLWMGMFLGCFITFGGVLYLFLISMDLSLDSNNAMNEQRHSILGPFSKKLERGFILYSYSVWSAFMDVIQEDTSDAATTACLH